MINPRNITTVGPENFWSFNLPTYQVTDEGIVDGESKILDFCKGDKSDPLKPRQEGFFVESLIEICVVRLKGINVGDLATKETACAITKLEEALMWLNKRSEDRKVRGVEQTYQK